MPRRRSLFGVPPGQWLAVFVIVTLVYAILYPVFQKVEKNTRDYRCLPNMKQLGLAYAEYEQDSDFAIPPGRNSAGDGWAGQIYFYAPYNSIYQCPDDLHVAPYISYAENRSIAKQHVGDFTNPARTVALYEFTTLNCDPSKPEAVSAAGLSAPQDSTRHDDKTFGLNFGFADGHAKYLTPGQVSGGANAVPPTHKGKYLATFAIK